MDPTFISLSVLAILVGSLLLALELGFILGHRAVQSREPAPAALVGPVQGALLGLLGLLLGFSFAGSAQRFMDRQDLIVEEANAIGTAYLRADLLDDPYGADLRRSLEDYLAYRLEVSRTLRGMPGPDVAAKIAMQHTAIWTAARDGVAAKPATMQGVLPPVNEVIDLHSTRIAAGRKHFPMPFTGLLIGCAWLSIAVIGYSGGLNRHRNLAMTGSLAFVVGAALWITIDLDHPRNGLIRLSDAPLHELQRSIQGPQ